MLSANASLLACILGGQGFALIRVTTMEKIAMATYLTLIKFTEHGEKDLKDTCQRAADFKTHAKKHGIEVKEQYWCLGAYDGFIVFDALDDETATAAMLSLSSRQSVTTQTLRSFNASEMSKIVGKIS
jgi:uncharacterized protein with GYD domain